MYPLLMQPDDVSYIDKCEWAYWDESIYAHYDENGNIIDEYEHGYGVLPFVFTHREEQIDEFFVDGANDIKLFDICGLGIAYRAQDLVKDLATISLEEKDLSKIIPIINNHFKLKTPLAQSNL